MNSRWAPPRSAMPGRFRRGGDGSLDRETCAEDDAVDPGDRPRRLQRRRRGARALARPRRSLDRLPETSSVLVMGHSFGGYTTLAGGGRRPTGSGPNSPTTPIRAAPSSRIRVSRRRGTRSTEQTMSGSTCRTAGTSPSCRSATTQATRSPRPSSRPRSRTAAARAPSRSGGRCEDATPPAGFVVER